MSEIIQISQGLQFYFENDEQQAAIDQVINQKKIPNDLSWSDVEKFNDAQLSAHSTQVHQWKLLNNIWESIWGKIVDGNKYIPVESIWYEKQYSLEYVWDYYLYKGFTCKNFILSTCCSATGPDGIQIGFSVDNETGNYDISNQLQLSDNWWGEADDDGVRWSKSKLLPIREKAGINIDELSNLAKEVITKLETVM